MADDFSMLKPYFVALYLSVGAFYLYLAVRYHRNSDAATLSPERNRIFPVLLPIAAAALLLARFAATGSYLLLAAAAIGTLIFVVRNGGYKAPLTVLSAAAAVSLVLSLVWWRMSDGAAAMPLAGFAVILGAVTFGFSCSQYRRPNTYVMHTAVFLSAGFLLQIDLGGYQSGEAILGFLAHHWGAFIGPAIHVKAGLVPFYDIPLQYGLGPTLAIAAVCRDADCWVGMEAIVVALNLANGLLILRMVLATAEPRDSLWCWTATAVVFASVFFWSGLPSDGSSLLAYPSSGAIRYFPTTLVACLLFFGRPTVAAIAFVPAVLWSPESAAMSVAVFGCCETARIGFVRAALRGAVLLAGSYFGLVLIHRAIFGVWIEPAALVEYVLHVPGALPIDPFSDAMLLAVLLGLGGWLMLRGSPDPVTLRRDRAATILLFATASFWFGRSHPNNICNLAPFLVLVAFRVIDRPAQASRFLSDVTTFGIATSVAALAMSPWNAIPFSPRATVDIHTVVANFDSLEPDIEQIRTRIDNPQGLGIADFGPSYTRHPSEVLIWTPMDPSSLWSYVPSERRQLYIRRSSARLRRSGWAIAEADQGFLLEDLRAGYTVAEQRSFVGLASTGEGAPRRYIAVCLDPRPDIAASTVGPACSPPGHPRP